MVQTVTTGFILGLVVFVAATPGCRVGFEVPDAGQDTDAHDGWVNPGDSVETDNDLPCDNKCTEEGKTFCEVGRLYTCYKASNSCLEWDAGVDCPSSVCASDAGCLGCVNQCEEPGLVMCHDARLHTCVQSDECLVWGNIVECPSGMCESNSACKPCVDECTDGVGDWCSEGSLYKCTQVDQCMVWVFSEECPTNECETDSTCLICLNLCPEAGLTRCSEGNLSTCVMDINCLAWDNGTVCPSQQCADEFNCFQVEPAQLIISDGPIYNFGQVEVGTFAEHTFTISNLGSMSAEDIAPILVPDALSFAGGDCTTSLSGGSTCQKVVRFTPPGAVGAQGSFEIGYHDGTQNRQTRIEIWGIGFVP